MKKFLQENWFKICIFVLCTALVYIIGINLSRNREAAILSFCIKQYDDNATLTSVGTFYGDPTQCLNRTKDLIK